VQRQPRDSCEAELPRAVLNALADVRSDGSPHDGVLADAAEKLVWAIRDQRPREGHELVELQRAVVIGVELEQR